MRKVSKKLCKSCRYRTHHSKEARHLCDYASIMKKVRADPIGYCSHYVEDQKRKGLRSFGY